MRIVGSNSKTRIAYAFPVGGEFGVSPFAEAKDGWRPIQRFGTKEELEQYATSKGCEVRWLDN